VQTTTGSKKVKMEKRKMEKKERANERESSYVLTSAHAQESFLLYSLVNIKPDP